MHPLELIPGVKVIRPKERGAIERMGEFHEYADPGFHFLIPFVDRLVRVNITEQMVNVQPSDMITQENLNAEVNLEVYFKPKISPDQSQKENKENLKKLLYNVDNHQKQIVALAKTTARAVIGKKNFEKVNSERDDLNEDLLKELDTQTNDWGIDVVRTELEEITPPDDVQKAMNERMESENLKEAAKEDAEAAEIEARGEKKAEIKRAEGARQAAILEAEGEAKAITTKAAAQAKKIEVENKAIDAYFSERPQVYKKLETVVDSLQSGSKYIIDADRDVTTVLSEVGGVTPIDQQDKDGQEDDLDLDVDMEDVAADLQNAPDPAEAAEQAEDAA